MTGLTRRQLIAAGGLALAGTVLPGLACGRAGRFTIELITGNDGRVLFRPAGLAVPAGATVTWVLASGVHTVTAYHPDNGSAASRIPARATPWDTGYLINTGQKFTRMFTMPGIYDYFCRPHERAGMVGRIVVLPYAGSEPGRDDLPEAARRALPPAARIMEEGRVDAWPESRPV